MTKAGIRGFLITMSIIIVGAVWFFVALPDGDFLWFLPIFDEQASEIRLYRDGEVLVLHPGDAGYDEVNDALNNSLGAIRAKLSRAISAESQQDFYKKYTAVEVFYANPVLIHSQHAFRKCTRLLIPLSGRHYDPPMVFGGTNFIETYRAGALVMKNREPLDQAVEAIWANQSVQVMKSSD